jgi:6-phosphogluconolactonase
VSTANLIWHEAASSDALADLLAGWVAERLTGAIAARGTAFLAVSGGSTPKLFFRALSRRDLDWSSVVVTLIDERFVDPSSPRSNQGLVEANLLQDGAKNARFVPLYNGADDPEEGARLAAEALDNAPWPLDVAVLGMGNDGHTASMFPDAPNLAALLDPRATKKVDAVHAASAGEPRLTLTLPGIVSAGAVVLHIEGDAKRQALETALEDSGPQKPIATVIGRAAKVEVFWTAG